MKKPSEAVERRICLEWDQERVPVHIRHVFTGRFR